MNGAWAIRAVEPVDDAALRALEQDAPERGALGVRLDLAVPHAELARRYPRSRGYVAVGTESGVIAGMLFSSVGPTQWDGAVAPAAYLFSLRVHPAWRRRGVATGLIAHAWAEARKVGATFAWALVGAANVASLKTFAAARFGRLPDVAVRVLFGGLPDPKAILAAFSGQAGRDSDWSIRSATADDLPALAAALNSTHAAHDLWRPCSPEELAARLTVPGHGLSDMLLAVRRGDENTIGAAGAVLHTRRLARFRVLAPRHRLGAALAPLLDAGVARLPLTPRVLRQRALGGWGSAAGRALLRRLLTGRERLLSPLVVPMDPRDPSWTTVSALPGITVPLHVVALGARSPGPSAGRLMYLG